MPLLFERKSNYRKTIRTSLLGLFTVLIFTSLSAPALSATTPLLLKDIQTSLSVTPGGPNGEQQDTTKYYTAKLEISAPRDFAVGDRIITGGRTTETFASFGLGLVREDALDQACSASTGSCNFPLVVNSERTNYNAQDSLTAYLAVGPNEREMLGVSLAEMNALFVLPIINTKNGGEFVIGRSSQLIASSPGRVLQATSVTTGNDISDALNIEFGNSNPKTNEKVNVKIAIKPDKIVADDANLGFSIRGKTNCGILSCNIAFEKDVNGPSTELEVQFTQAIFGSPGQKQLKIEYSSKISGGQTIRRTYLGQKDFTLGPADQSNQSMTVTLSKETRDGGNAIKEFTVTQPGATKFEYQCDQGGAYNSVTPSNGSAKFTCTYLISNPKTYKIQIVAKDGSGNTLETKNTTVVITGTEGNSGDNASQNKVTDGGAITKFLNTILAAIAGALQEIIYFIFTNIVAKILVAILAIRTFTQEFADIIRPAHYILRSVANIAFIIAIIGIGVGTVFRISGWQSKDLLVKLILGAIFVNFSLVIPQAILGVAETLQNQFLPADQKEVGYLAATLMGTLPTGMGTVFRELNPAELGQFGDTVKIVTTLLLSFASLIAFLAIAVILFARLIALWILLMLAPLPWVANIFPATRSWFKKWWVNFFCWAFKGVVIGFMLNLTALIAKFQLGNVGSLTGSSLGGVAGSTFGGIVVLGFLFATVKIGSTACKEDSFGGIGQLAQKAAMWPGNKLKSYGAGKAKAGKEYLGEKAMQGRYAVSNQLFSPKSTDGPTKAFLRSAGAKTVGNVLTGGAYSQAKKDLRKEDLRVAQGRAKAQATDYRLKALGKPANEEDKFKKAEFNDKVKKAKDLAENDTHSFNSERAKQINDLKKDSSGQAEFLARTNKALEDKQMDEFAEAVGGRKDSAAILEYAAKNGADDTFLNLLRNKINATAAKDGRIDQMIDDKMKLEHELVSQGKASVVAKDDDGKIKKDANGNDVYEAKDIVDVNTDHRMNVFMRKTAIEQAKVSKEMFADLERDAAGNPIPDPDNKGKNKVIGLTPEAATLISNATQPAVAAGIVAELNAEKKALFKNQLKNGEQVEKLMQRMGDDTSPDKKKEFIRNFADQLGASVNWTAVGGPPPPAPAVTATVTEAEAKSSKKASFKTGFTGPTTPPDSTPPATS